MGFRVHFSRSGAVRNSDRKCKAFSLRSKIWFPRVGNQIWVSTPQNRTIGVNLGISCSRRLGRTALRRQILVVQTPLKSNRLSYTLKNTVKSNFIPSELRHFRTKELGFTRFLLDVACMEKTSFFYDFYGFGGVRSTQPTMPRSI